MYIILLFLQQISVYTTWKCKYFFLYALVLCITSQLFKDAFIQYTMLPVVVNSMSFNDSLGISPWQFSMHIQILPGTLMTINPRTSTYNPLTVLPKFFFPAKDMAYLSYPLPAPLSAENVTKIEIKRKKSASLSRQMYKAESTLEIKVYTCIFFYHHLLYWQEIVITL